MTSAATKAHTPFILRFGAIGIVNTALDVGLFTLFRATIFDDAPLTAKALSMAVAATMSAIVRRSAAMNALCPSRLSKTVSARVAAARLVAANSGTCRSIAASAGWA